MIEISNHNDHDLTAPRAPAPVCYTIRFGFALLSETRELVIFSKLSFGRAYELMVPIGNVISSLPQLDHKRVPHPRHDG